MDRLVRRLLDLADVIRWGQDHSVCLVSATESILDLTAPFIPPWGYLPQRDEDGDWRLIEDPEQVLEAVLADLA